MSKSIYDKVNQDAEKAKQNLDKFSLLKMESIPCHYARFHQPVPPGADNEPVGEFTLAGEKRNKYSVDEMLYHPTAGLIFKALSKRKGIEEDIVPAANIIYVRL